MKLEQIDPEITPWRAGTTRCVGTWRYYDRANDHPDNGMQREVWHYSTLMGVFSHEHGSWSFYPVSTGWGSVSDQQGMNKIIHGYGWRFVRKGGSRYVNVWADRSTINAESAGV